MKETKKRRLSVLLTVCMVLTMLPAAAPPAAAAANTAISDMTALDALGIDTSEAPAGYDPDDQGNPYGKDTTLIAEVDELYALEIEDKGFDVAAKGNLYGDNSPLLGDEAAILDSGTSLNGNAVGPYTVCVEGNFSYDNNGQKKQTVSLSMNSEDNSGESGDTGDWMYQPTTYIYVLVQDPQRTTCASFQLGKYGAYSFGGTLNDKGTHTGPLYRYTVDVSGEVSYPVWRFKNEALAYNLLKVAAGDFDGDGIDEIAVYDPTDNGMIRVYDLQEMDGTSYNDANNWILAWTYYLDEVARPTDISVCRTPNMVSLSAADFDKDGTDDLAVSWGYHGVEGDTGYSSDTKAVLLRGCAAGDMMTESLPISLDSDLERVSFTTGDVDGDGYNELVVGGSLSSSSSYSRYVAVYEWTGSGFTLSQSENFDLFKKEDGSYVYAAADRGDDTFYSSPTAVANIAVGKFNGISEPCCIYLDSLIIELGDNGLELDRMLDKTSDTIMYSYVEWGVRAADLNGDDTDVPVTVVANLGVKFEEFASGAELWEALYAALTYHTYPVVRVLLGADNKSAVSMTGSGKYGAFCLPNTDNDTTQLTYSKEHYYTYSDPEILAVLASPPYFKDLMNDELTVGDMSSTTFGKTTGTGAGMTQSNSFYVGVYSSWEYSCDFFGVELFSAEAEMEIRNSFTWETELVSTTEYTAEYGTLAGQDTVAFYSIPVETYVYTAQVPVADSSGVVTGYETQTMTVNIPHAPTVKTMALDTYERIAADYEELPQVADSILTHTTGEPGTYPSSTARLGGSAAGNVLLAPAEGDPAPSTSYGLGYQTRAISMTSEAIKSFNYELSIDTKAGVGGGGVKVGVTAGSSIGLGTVAVSTAGCSYTGEIHDMPAEAEDYGYGFTWRLAAFDYNDGSNAFPVVTYLVSEVEQPPALPDNFAQQEDGTSQNQIALTWDYTGSPAGFLITRYFRSAGASGFYEVAYVSASDQTAVLSQDGDPRTYRYIDTGLGADTEYQYQIQTISASYGKKSVPSRTLTAYTKPEGIVPEVNVSATALTAYPDIPATATAVVTNSATLSGGTLSYQWQKQSADGKSWTNLTSQTNLTLTILNAGLDDEGLYRCRVTSRQDQTVVSSYSPTVTVTYSKRTPVLQDLAVNDNTLSVKVVGDGTNSIPSGTVVFTLSAAGYSKDYAAALDTAGRASVKVSAVSGVYAVSAAYTGSRVFQSGSTAVGSNGEAVFYSSNISAGTTFVDCSGTYTYGDKLNIMEYTFDESGKVTSAAEIDYTNAQFAVTATLSQGTAIVLPEKLGADKIKDRFTKGYAAYTGEIYMKYKNQIYQFNVQKADLHVSMDLTGLPTTVQVSDFSTYYWSTDRGSHTPGDGSLGDRVVLEGLISFGMGDQDVKTDIVRAVDGTRTIINDNWNQNYSGFLSTPTPGQRILQPVVMNGGAYGVNIPLGFDGTSTAGVVYRISIGDNYNYTVEKYTITITAKEYSVTAAAEQLNDQEAGTIAQASPSTGRSTYPAGTTLVFTAAPYDGYQVDHWTVNGANVENNATTRLTHVLTTDGADVKVSFKTKENTLSWSANPEAAPAGDGTGKNTVTNSQGIGNGNIVAAGAEVAFTANPADGWHFSGWEYYPEGGATQYGGELTYEVTMPNASVRLYANFERDAYTLTLPDSLTAVDSDGKMLDISKAIVGDTMITVKPAPGYELAADPAWTATEGVTDTDSDDGTFTFKLTRDTEINASAAEGSYTVTLTEPENGAVTVTDSSGSAVDLTGPVTGGAKLTFTAAPNRGYRVSQWNGEGSTSETYTCVVSGDMDVSVTFAEKPNRSIGVAVRANSNASITCAVGELTLEPQNGSVTIYEGETLTVIAKPATAYMMAGWYVTRAGSGREYENSTAKSYTIPYASTIDAVEAVTQVISYNKVEFGAGEGGSISATDDGTVITSPATTVIGGSKLVFTAAPDSGYRVARWTVNGEPVAGLTAAVYTVDALDGNLEVSVTFEAETETLYGITLGTSQNGTLSYLVSTGRYDGKAAAGDTVIVTAQPNDNYFLEGLSAVYNDGEENEDEITGSFTMPEADVTVQAIFTEIAVESIRVNSSDHKTVYTVGDELDVSGLTILVEKNDGTSETVNVSSDMVADFDSTAATDRHELTITYKDKKTTYYVSVNSITPDIPTVYQLVVNLNGGNGATVSGAYAEGEQISIHAGSRTNYTFNGWTSAAGGKFADANAASTIFTMPANSTTIAANWTSNSAGGSGGGSSGSGGGSSGSGGGSSGSGGGSTADASAVSDPVTTGNSTTVTVTVIPDNSDGVSGATVSAGVANGAVERAVEAAGSAKTSAVVKIAVNTPVQANGIEVTLPTAAVRTLSKQANAQLIITSGVADVSLDADALVAVAEQAGTNITILVRPVENDKLNSRQQQTVGDAPVFDVTIKSGSTIVSDFGGGHIRVAIPYALSANQRAEGLAVYYLDDMGELHLCATSYNNGKLTFDTDHLSKYVVMYDERAEQGDPFTDVAAGAYYYDAVLWAVENGVTNGTAAVTFAPDTSCTRAQVVTFLWRACGSPAPAAAESPFADVRADAYYHKAASWAVEQGITTGTGDVTFSPDDACTRAQIVTLLWRRMGSPVVNYAMDFADVDESAYYAEAVRWAVSEGITSGTRAGFFSPGDACTRGQTVTFLYRALTEN